VCAADHPGSADRAAGRSADRAGTRPVIGITGRRFEPGRMFKLEAALALPADYCDAVERAGGVAATLIPSELDEHRAASIAASIAGLVLSGGPDVDPARYGEDPEPEVYGIDTLQDSFELALLDAMVDAGKPVLAICRGLQLVNVAFGGSLDQHITGREGMLAHGIPNGGGGSDNKFAVEPATLLSGILASGTPTGRCHHHQAIGRLGDGLTVTARTGDGVVEGIELADATADGSWFVGVQWHPEETAAEDPFNQRLFDELVARSCR